jgi:hypothetical protein
MSTVRIMTKLNEALPRCRIIRILQIEPKLFRLTFDSEQNVNSALKHYNDHAIPGSILEPPRRLTKDPNRNQAFVLHDVPKDLSEEDIVNLLNEHDYRITTTKRLISGATGQH